MDLFITALLLVVWLGGAVGFLIALGDMFGSTLLLPKECIFTSRRWPFGTEVKGTITWHRPHAVVLVRWPVGLSVMLVCGWLLGGVTTIGIGLQDGWLFAAESVAYHTVNYLKTLSGGQRSDG